MEIPELRGASAFTRFSYASFVVLGLVTTLLGTTLPLLAFRFGISTARAGQLFFWQFLVATSGTVLSAVAYPPSFSRRARVLLGLALCELGVSLLASAGWNGARFAVACYGFGLGTAIPAMNLLVGAANPLRRAQAVAILNFSWALGALAGPALLNVLHDLRVYLLSVATLSAVVLVGAIMCPAPDTRNWGDAEGSAYRQTSMHVAGVLAFAMFALCGVENALAGWASSLVLPTFSSAFAASAATAAFWISFLASRGSSPLLLSRISEGTLFIGSAVIACAGIAGLYVAQSVPATLIACAVCGIGVGPGFPLAIARVSERLGERNPAATLCFACAGTGAAVLTPLVGFVGAQLGAAKLGLIVPFWSLVMVLAVAGQLFETVW